MATLEAELKAARELSIPELADQIEAIGFQCTDCGRCCRGDPHTATIFPEEIRSIEGAWTDVARPIPWGLDADGTGTTFEWALQVDRCGDCRFHDGDACQIYSDRPSICRVYPFRLAPLTGEVTTDSCPGVGGEIERSRATTIARRLKTRAITSRKQALALKAAYRPVDAQTVVYDSEGPKHPDGTPIPDGE